MSGGQDGPGAAAMLGRVLADPSAESPDVDDIAVRVLDAAYDQFSSIGIRRSSMDDVARRAGVARITIYRRFPNKEALVEAVTRREFRRYLDQFREDIKGAESTAERVMLGFVSSIKTMRRNPILEGMIIGDPQALARSMIGDGGRLMSVVSGFVAHGLRLEQAAGNIAADVRIDLIAELMVRVSGSYLALPGGVVDVDDDEQLAEVARCLLVPLLDSQEARFAR